MFANQVKTVFLFVLIAVSYAQLDIKLGEDSTSSIVQDESTSLNSTTASVPTTITVPTTTTTTTTPAPETTTTKPTTTTTTTTSAPDTTTTTTTKPTPGPTPAPGPKPTPKPDIGMYSWSEENKTCVIVQLAIQLNLTYLNTDNKTVNTLYNVPNNTETKVLAGNCGNDSQSITLGWGAQKSNQLTILFNITTGSFSLDKLEFIVNATQQLPAALSNQILNITYVGYNFTTPVAMSYHCLRPQILYAIQNQNGNQTDTIELSHLQLEAFHKEAEAQFSTAIDCDAVITPDIVPIAVGLALAALVVIVLVAYLIARRRSQARGYLSM